MPHHAADGVAGWSQAFLTLPDRLPRVLSLLKPSSAALKNCSRPHNQHDGSDPTAPRSLSRLCQAPAFEQPVGSFRTAPPDPGSWPAPLWGQLQGTPAPPAPPISGDPEVRPPRQTCSLHVAQVSKARPSLQYRDYEIHIRWRQDCIASALLCMEP